MQLIGVPNWRPCVGVFLFDCDCVQLPQFPGVLRQSPAQRNRSGAPLFQGSVVKKGIGHGVQNLVTEHGRLYRVPSVHLNLSLFDGCQNPLQAWQVHRLGETVANGLEYQRVIRRFDFYAGGVVLALYLGRKHCRQQVLRAHPLQGSRHLAASGMTEQGQKPRGIPPPSRTEYGRLENRLQEYVSHSAGG